MPLMPVRRARSLQPGGSWPMPYRRGGASAVVRPACASASSNVSCGDAPEVPNYLGFSPKWDDSTSRFPLVRKIPRNCCDHATGAVIGFPSGPIRKLYLRCKTCGLDCHNALKLGGFHPGGRPIFRGEPTTRRGWRHPCPEELRSPHHRSGLPGRDRPCRD